MDEFVYDEEELIDGGGKGDLDDTIPAIAPTPDERKRERNQIQGQKKRAKARERRLRQEMEIYAGLKSENAINEENQRRRIEGAAMRERG